MPHGEPPCERCQSRRLKCHVDKNAQSILEEANRWRGSLTGQVSQLQTAVNILLRMSRLPPLASYQSSSNPEDDMTQTSDEVAGEADETLPLAPILTPVAPEEDSLYTLPINSLYEATRLPALRNPTNPETQTGTAVSDFISRGALTEAAAQQLLFLFKNRLNYFCYGILCPHDTLHSLRSSSRLLTAAICAVASLHDPDASATFKVCHAEFLRLVSSNMFSVSYSCDDLRALIVGAYWLGNVSYTLLGHAIRIAMRLNHHLAYFSVIENPGNAGSVEKARLWYCLYIMDHHSSILYGRPALISPKEEAHQQWERFIEVNGHAEVDLRMSSQVALYHIIAKVKDVFGGYSHKTIPAHCFAQLLSFLGELDRWYMIWGDRMPRNAHVGWFPRDGAILHYHFARLHLCSYIFRSMSLESAATASLQVQDFASVAVTSATSVLELVLERDDLRTALVGMPIYFHGMITFAAVFLTKATKNNFWELTTIDVPKVFALLQRYVSELRSQKAARQHLVYHMSNGLDDMMRASRKLTEESTEISDLGSMEQPQMMLTMDSMFDMNTFDLLQESISQDMNTIVGQGDEWQNQYEMWPE
ncbi:unnamed protein product [Clonostachys rhizophaga]|uniref:Xylanolytic transcriptional activator regulatory domain-containing protein n=1 Tax=Clonostachys rhizophaga TaxID=160324 RepID=A0A9N9YIR7_9HYPO|nr:unnamed protein product [Clonostachys rhizophaga]